MPTLLSNPAEQALPVAMPRGQRSSGDGLEVLRVLGVVPAAVRTLAAVGDVDEQGTGLQGAALDELLVAQEPEELVAEPFPLLHRAGLELANLPVEKPTVDQGDQVGDGERGGRKPAQKPANQMLCSAICPSKRVSKGAARPGRSAIRGCVQARNGTRAYPGKLPRVDSNH